MQRQVLRALHSVLVCVPTAQDIQPITAFKVLSAWIQRRGDTPHLRLYHSELDKPRRPGTQGPRIGSDVPAFSSRAFLRGSTPPTIAGLCGVRHEPGAARNMAMLVYQPRSPARLHGQESYGTRFRHNAARLTCSIGPGIEGSAGKEEPSSVTRRTPGNGDVGCRPVWRGRRPGEPGRFSPSDLRCASGADTFRHGSSP